MIIVDKGFWLALFNEKDEYYDIDNHQHSVDCIKKATIFDRFEQN